MGFLTATVRRFQHGVDGRFNFRAFGLATTVAMLDMRTMCKSAVFRQSINLERREGLRKWIHLASATRSQDMRIRLTGDAPLSTGVSLTAEECFSIRGPVKTCPGCDLAFACWACLELRHPHGSVCKSSESAFWMKVKTSGPKSSLLQLSPWTISLNNILYFELQWNQGLLFPRWTWGRAVWGADDTFAFVYFQ